ncbi:hypothetical protein A2960_02540 [Candidatus Gottesmanbacteria bacterium RIFCSPLOWO2_01_FULL_39_12b]|uniref:Bacterial Ig-like domain-containing protein n=1 Tax=Candidatus Gottesmanbacteria bacterium RIFCSPLOWO2_01_FULL_39_12b TaxID=1798388 RepID=A0A1F6AQN7_9BACT|nr:MAG: hypothetical protein A2960_02540 [Candidatus Gottesmanbacteria bacterium RIFCSPLOWO2_01_FULL_39_12b]
MKKDVYMAILAGFVIGTIVALTILNLPKIVKKQVPATKDELALTASPNPTPLPKTIVTLDIEEPVNYSLASSKTIKISGKTGTNNFLITENEEGIDLIQATESGSFSSSFSLREGNNNIYITSLNDKDEEMTKSINVFWTGEKL